MKTAYALSEVRKTYKGADRPANDGISFEVPSGEAVGIIGPNGAGKTTLVRSMLGLLRPDGGRMKFIIASYENSFSKCMILRETPGKPRSNVSKRQYDPILHE